jgi:hypothetical protein
MSKRYYKATDGVLTVFRATTRVFASARFTTETPPGGLPHPYMFGPRGGIGFSSKPVSPGKYVVVEITEAEFDALQAAKVERIKATGGNPSDHTSHQDSWVRNRCLEAV